MNDFQTMLKELKESTTFIAIEESTKAKKEDFIPFSNEDEKERETLKLENSTLKESDTESIILEKICEIQKSINELKKKIEAINRPKIEKNISPSDMSKFLLMLEYYYYSFTINKDISFENPLFNLYRDKLIIISQNILANSFRFFEKNDILDRTIILGKKIKDDSSLTHERIDKLEIIFENMSNALQEPEYKKDYFFAKFLNDRGLILNSITIINEMLGEYIVESIRKLSPLAQERIDIYLNKIEISRTTRKGYYNFYKRAKAFFRSHFSKVEGIEPVTFFRFKDQGNREIEKEMTKLFKSNKRNKSNLFVSYSHLIEDVRLIRNDLAHGNNSEIYGDIQSNINEVLIDFKYLSIKKNFLKHEFK